MVTVGGQKNVRICKINVYHISRRLVATHRVNPIILSKRKTNLSESHRNNIPILDISTRITKNSYYQP